MRLAPPLTLAVLALIALAPATAHASGGALPPLELELGQASIATPQGEVAATEVLVGLSFASLYPRPTPIDVSVGWVGTFVPAPATAEAARMTSTAPPADTSGGFLALEARAAEGAHWRAWIGGRAELLSTEDTRALGAFGRVSVELWRPVVATGNGGGIVGTLAIAAWAEIGMRERVGGGLGSVVAGGLGVRLPLVAAR
ncbi:MAG: hypothetical protein IPL61_36525 [Myxococcales bacterium]|nr:hypothetical protein [Myxococcales bacterium]